jgi:DNA anti-recombination protein RmuC
MRTFDNQSESLWEKSEQTDSNKMGSSHPISEMLQSLSAQIDAEMAHSKQLNDNYRELEHAFQQLQTKNQNLCEELKQMHNLNNELHLEYQHHLQYVYAPARDKVKKLGHLIENLKTMIATSENSLDVDIKKEGEQKFYSIQE